jgi:hypothetical protein
MDENEEKKPKKIYYVGFNYDYTYFSIGTDIGFQIYETNPLNLTISRELNGGIGLVNILEKTNIFFLVGGGKYPRFTPNKLIIWDDDKSEIAKEFRCNSFIINCYIKQNCIFIICSDSITLVNTKTMKVIKYINTINNPKGISSISNDPKKYIFTFPDKDKGNIIILNIIELENDNSEKIKKIEQLDNKDIVIKNAHKGNCITNLRHFFNKNHNIDLIMSISAKNNNIKIWNCKNWICLLNIKDIYPKGIINSACFIHYDNNLYILSSNNNWVQPDFIKIFNFEGNSIGNIKNSNENVYYIETYFEECNSHVYVITGNYNSVR